MRKKLLLGVGLMLSLSCAAQDKVDIPSLQAEELAALLAQESPAAQRQVDASRCSGAPSRGQARAWKGVMWREVFMNGAAWRGDIRPIMPQPQRGLRRARFGGHAGAGCRYCYPCQAPWRTGRSG